jgi:hypothetical protein
VAVQFHAVTPRGHTNAGTVTCKTMSMGCLVGFPDSRARDRLAMLFNRPLLLTLNNQPCCIAACELAIDVLSRATPTELLSCSRPRPSDSKMGLWCNVHRSRGLSATKIFWSQNPGPKSGTGPKTEPKISTLRQKLQFARAKVLVCTVKSGTGPKMYKKFPL